MAGDEIEEFGKVFFPWRSNRQAHRPPVALRTRPVFMSLARRE
jgi:hypothetical protein